MRNSIMKKIKYYLCKIIVFDNLFLQFHLPLVSEYKPHAYGNEYVFRGHNLVINELKT